MEGDPRYLALLEQLRHLHLKKSADYGKGADPLANLRGSADIGIAPWKGAYLRLKDKTRRMDSFCLNGRLECEGVRDTLLDLAAYSLLVLLLFEEEGQTDALRTNAKPADLVQVAHPAPKPQSWHELMEEARKCDVEV